MKREGRCGGCRSVVGVVNLKRFALLARSEANLAREPTGPSAGRKPGEGHYQACELEVLIDGQPLGGEGASSVERVGPWWSRGRGKPLKFPSLSFSRNDDSFSLTARDESRPGWRHRNETIEPVYGPGSFSLSYAVTLVGGETHAVNFEGLGPSP